MNVVLRSKREQKVSDNNKQLRKRERPKKERQRGYETVVEERRPADHHGIESEIAPVTDMTPASSGARLAPRAPTTSPAELR